jgi:hypothetical protein
MYALLAGSHNVGGLFSNFIGAALLSQLGVTPSGSIGESNKFDNLWKAALIGSILPTISIALIPFCIPDTSQSELLLLVSGEENIFSLFLRIIQVVQLMVVCSINFVIGGEKEN